MLRGAVEQQLQAILRMLTQLLAFRAMFIHNASDFGAVTRHSLHDVLRYPINESRCRGIGPACAFREQECKLAQPPCPNGILL